MRQISGENRIPPLLGEAEFLFFVDLRLSASARAAYSGKPLRGDGKRGFPEGENDLFHRRKQYQPFFKGMVSQGARAIRNPSDQSFTGFSRVRGKEGSCLLDAHRHLRKSVGAGIVKKKRTSRTPAPPVQGQDTASPIGVSLAEHPNSPTTGGLDRR